MLHDYHNKVIIIYDGKVVDAYSDKSEAYHKAQQDHELVPGTFVMELCTEEEDHRYVKTYQRKISFD